MARVPIFRRATARVVIAVLLTLALPAQWDAFCDGWRSPQDAMACCRHASHDAGPTAAVACCAAQEQARQGQPHAPAPILAPPVSVPTLIIVPVLSPRYTVSTRRVHTVDSCLLDTVLLI